MAGSNNVLGIIFANINDEVIPQLTNHRTLASVPFGGKYRLIDFPLSNMSNSGINNVGVITESNYLSLMDHVGSGNAWDLSKRKSGLSIIPPNAGKNYDNEIEIIFHLREYFEHFKEEYVILCYANTVANI
ncbi:MAG: sugar phosphate nucleotidyltransferase, partial [Acutalibacteraceae bacterium]